MPQENSIDVIELCENKRKGKEIGREITQSCKDLGADIKLQKPNFINGEFIFKVKWKGKTSINQLKRLAQDIRIRSGLQKLRIYEKGKYIYIIVSKSSEKPNADLLAFLSSDEYVEEVKNLNIAHAIGLDEMGNSIVSDLTLYPHVLIGGTTGSGKSMAVLALLISFLGTYDPKQLRLIIGDKAGELMMFNNFPHLACPVITEFNQLYIALQALVHEMTHRTKLMENNKSISFPYIILVLDEFPSFISGNEQQKKEARALIEDILGRGRHTQIHVVLVASNPTKEKLKLDITNLPTKLIFRVTRLCYSTSILGVGGAEKLSGNGEMLFQSSISGDIKTIQGFYISPEDLQRTLENIRNDWNEKSFDLDFAFQIDLNVAADSEMHSNKRNQKLLADLIIWSIQQPTISCNQLMLNFSIGWNNANKLMSVLEDFGVIGELEAKLPRKVCSEVPEKALDFLRSGGYSEEEIAELLQNRFIEPIE